MACLRAHLCGFLVSHVELLRVGLVRLENGAVADAISLAVQQGPPRCARREAVLWARRSRRLEPFFHRPSPAQVKSLPLQGSGETLRMAPHRVPHVDSVEGACAIARAGMPFIVTHDIDLSFSR